MLDAVDNSQVTRHQKHRLFKQGICPRLSWHLLVDEFTMTWLERDLQPLATKFLKKWSGLSRSANTAILFLSSKKGGLALPSLVGLYKKQQSSRMVQLFTSRDIGVRHTAQQRLQEESGRQRMNFRPAVVVNEIISQGNSQSRHALTGAVKTLLAEEDAEMRLDQLCSLPVQGDMARRWEGCAAELWMRAVQGLPPEAMKFALNVSLDSLLTNSNLHTWGKKSRDTCALCSLYRQSLPHIQNNSPVVMDLHQYSRRHDEVLQILGDFAKAHLPSSFNISIDLPSSTYSFPHHNSPY